MTDFETLPSKLLQQCCHLPHCVVSWEEVTFHLFGPLKKQVGITDAKMM
jgi:hypothetical protein